MKHANLALAVVLVTACSTEQRLKESTTTKVGPGGGFAASSDEQLRIFIPPGALSAEIDVVIERRERTIFSRSHEYEIQPAGLSLLLPATFSLQVPLVTFAGRPAIASVPPEGMVVLAGPERASATWLEVRRRAIPPALGVVDVPAYSPCSTLACGASCSTCDPALPACEQPADATFCAADGLCGESPQCNQPLEIDGWDQPPAAGRVFVIDSIHFAAAGHGFDVNASCRGPGDCIDNVLAPLGQLLNDTIRQGLLGGEILLLIELAGVDEPYIGEDASATIKLYRARDADDPFFPANNFQVPAGETECCRFRIQPTTVAGIPPQARTRAPIHIERGAMESLAPFAFELPLPLGVPPRVDLPPRIDVARISARIPATFARVLDGLIGAAWPISSLAQAPNPFCRAVADPLCPATFGESTMIDLALAFAQPDVDLDGDGLEQLERDVLGSGRVKTCIDGDGRVVPPHTAAEPWTCALQPEMADGFSLALEIEAVRAQVVAIGGP